MKSKLKLISFLATVGVILGTTVAATADDFIANLRGGALDSSEPAPSIPQVIDSPIREVRNYPEQPPLIPHKIDGYQVTLNANKCLSCHSRAATGESQAPMVSITHFMNRDSQFLASVSPRRYFCNLCHVPQYDSRPLVENDFVDVDSVLAAPTSR